MTGGDNGNGYGPRLARLEDWRDHMEPVIARMGSDVARIQERQKSGQERAEEHEQRVERRFDDLTHEMGRRFDALAAQIERQAETKADKAVVVGQGEALSTLQGEAKERHGRLVLIEGWRGWLLLAAAAASVVIQIVLAAAG